MAVSLLKGDLYDSSHSIINTCASGEIGRMNVINPLTPISDQDRISPYNINTMLTR